LESSTKNYIVDHRKYVCNKSNGKCKFHLHKSEAVNDALEHLLVCPGKLEAWSFFTKDSKKLIPLTGNDLNHHYDYDTIGNVPECLDPIEKRFLLRLFMSRGFLTNVIDCHGNVRSPVDVEINAFPDIPPMMRENQKEKKSKKRRLK